MSNDIQKELSLLRKLSKQMEGKRLEVNMADRFNPFRFFRKDELGLSAILAFLLDPKETHGQGDLFLNSFLEKLNLHHFLAYDQVDVIVEKTTENNRRHDIFIRGILNDKTQWVLSIENKLNWAKDQDKQIEDYLADLISYEVGNNYFILYLPVNYCNPSKDSIDEKEWEHKVESGNAKVWDQNIVIDWLNNVEITNREVKSFIKFFVKHLKERVMGENKDYSLLVNEMAKETNILNLALDIIRSKDEFLKIIASEFKSNLKGNSPDWIKSHWEICNNESETEALVIINTKNNLGIKILFNTGDYQNLYWGIYNVSSNQNIEKVREILSIDLSGEFKKNSKNSYWLYWDWIESSWEKLPTKEFSNEVWTKIKPIAESITKTNVD